ncbi:MAG: hypothetical protein ABIP13_08665 [Tepidiformaceae bacterium]
MSTTKKRFDQAAEGLTARERAIVVLGSWIEGGELDRHLIKNAPADQRQECHRIVDAIAEANAHMHQA